MSVAKVVHRDIKLPPSNLEAEEALLGGLLLDQSRLDEVAASPLRLSPDHFFHGPNGVIFGTMLELREVNHHIDAITLTEKLKARGLYEQVGGSRYLSQLFERVPDPSSIQRYAEIIKDKSLLRGLDRLGRSISERSNDEQVEVEPFLDAVSRDLLNLIQHRHAEDYMKLEDAIVELVRQIDERKKNGNRFTGIRTGFSRLDQLTLGFQPSDLIILAARPSVGKTALAMNVAVNAAAEGKKVAVFSLEMSAEQLAMRLVSGRGRIDAQALKRGDVSSAEMLNAIHHLAHLEIYIDDTPGITPLELRSKCRMLERRHGLDLVVVDYLQLMQGPSMKRSDSRVQEISEISRALKGIARELKVPVLALSQLSRAVESRQDKRPQLSDLRESGAIEQDADLVMFLWRKDEPSNYKGETPANLNEFRETSDVVLMLSKHRNGPTGEIALTFEKRFTNFAETMVGHGREVSFDDEF